MTQVEAAMFACLHTFIQFFIFDLNKFAFHSCAVLCHTIFYCLAFLLAQSEQQEEAICEFGLFHPLAYLEDFSCQVRLRRCFV